MRILAHGIGVVRDLPIPAIYFFVGATVVLGASFVLLLALWRRPVLEAHAGGRALPKSLSRILLSLPLRGVLGAFSVIIAQFGAISSYSGSGSRSSRCCSGTSGRR